MKYIATTSLNWKTIFSLLLTINPTLSFASNNHIVLYDLKAPSPWTVSATPAATFISYSSSSQRDHLYTLGLATEFKYLERGGITIEVSRSDLKFRTSSPNSDINQILGYLSGQLNFTPDRLIGFLTLRMDLVSANNNDTSNETNNVKIFSPQVSFINYAQTYSFGLGYAQSTYGESLVGNGTLSVSQWTPTVGFGFDNGSDWLQFRPFIIRVSNPARAHNYSSTNSVETKWIHYFSGHGWIPEQLYLIALFGTRIYAVDASNVYNQADVQKNSAALALQWLVARDTRLFIQGGRSNFEAANLASGGMDTYSASYIYLGITHNW